MSCHRYWKAALAASLVTAAAWATIQLLPGLPGLATALGLVFLLLLASFRSPGHRGLEAGRAELVGSVSHELRTPLNGILGLTQVLLEGKLTGDQRETLEMIRASGENLLRVINDLLDYSKIRTGKIRLAPEEFRLRRWVRQTVTLHAPQAHRKGLELCYWVAPQVPEWVEGDPERLRQVLSNLIANAVKFTPTGDVLVEVSSRAAPDEAALVRFSVKDTGIGISGGGRSEIFRPFVQGDNATPEHGGLGLGLAISAEIVERMNGSISVASLPGEGSTFAFEVRFDRARWEEERRTESFRGHRALVLDPSPAQRSVMARALRGLDIEAELAADPAAALDILGRSLPSDPPLALVLLDSGLRGFDLPSLAQEIRRRDPAPIVLLSRTHEQLEMDSLRPHGIVGRLTKPVAPSHLLRAIEILQRGRSLEKPEEVQTHGMERPLLAGLEVLVAEDHPINRAVVVRMLDGLGSVVTAASNGKEALALLSRARFGLLLLDLEMPELDGLTLARRIRERESGTGAHLPIVALTAHAGEEDRARCREAGVDGFLVKPVAECELVSAMAAALKRSSREAEGLPVFVREEALRRANGDEALLAELAQLFLEETPEGLRELAGCLEAGEERGAARLAHRLRGALLTLSAPAAASAALALETAASGGDRIAAAEALARLQEEIERLEAELKPLGTGSKVGSSSISPPG